MKRFTQVFLGLMAVAFCKVGVEALVNPAAVVGQVGISLDNPSALSSIRAVYGGMHLVFGLFCAWGIFKRTTQLLVLVALYTAGFVIGRVSGIIVDGMPNEFVITWLITEATCLLMALTSLWQMKSVNGLWSEQAGVKAA